MYKLIIFLMLCLCELLANERIIDELKSKKRSSAEISLMLVYWEETSKDSYDFLMKKVSELEPDQDGDFNFGELKHFCREMWEIYEYSSEEEEDEDYEEELAHRLEDFESELQLFMLADQIKDSQSDEQKSQLEAELEALIAQLVDREIMNLQEKLNESKKRIEKDERRLKNYKRYRDALIKREMLEILQIDE